MDGFIPNHNQTDANGAIINGADGQPLQNGPLQQIGGALHTIWVTLSQPEYQAELWKYIIYREPPKPLGSTDFVLFVRKDVAQLWHRLQYDPSASLSTDVPVQQDWTGQPTPSQLQGNY